MKKKKIIYSLGILTVVAIGFVGASFALWIQNFTQSGENTIASDCFHITLTEDKGILLENSFPMYDKDGKKLTPYTFQVRNECSRKVEYQLNFETTNHTTLNDSYVKFMFQNNEPVLLNEIENTQVTLSNGKSAYVLEKGYFEGNTTKDYSIRIWMDENITQENTDAMNKLFEGKITITASYLTKYYESILNGTDPVLKEGLIPVTIDNNGTVKKADITKEWYRYEKQQWANAVILENEKEEYLEGQVIPENNIESYFVWIPRYKYKIWNMGKYETLTTVDYNQVHIIDVIFGTDTTKDTEYECATPNQSGADGTCSVGKYMTHPAFTSFDTEDKIANGLWVGKFETGYKEANSTSEAEQNPNGGAPDKVQIKPNVYSWRGIQVANAHLSSYNYKRNLDSHMMKNTEWGAVAYLQHSKYGSHTSVRFNNNSAYITGYAAVSEPTCGYTATNEDCNRYEKTNLGVDGTYTVNYFNSESIVASTTGNISGIYDMSGGAWEYVAGVMFDSSNTNPCSGKNVSENSGFNGPFCNTLDSLINGISDFPSDTKYYDAYVYSTDDQHYHRRILGDATGEMGPFDDRLYSTFVEIRKSGSWYYDEAYFVYSELPWFLRGGLWYLGNGTGVFAFIRDRGSVHGEGSFRVVLSV